MIPTQRFALNRILAPRLGLQEFMDVAQDLGISKIELRNDLPGIGIIDSYTPKEVRTFCNERGVSIISINAIQKFNLGPMRKTALEELKRLIDLAKEIDCSALVLCPNNDPTDSRKPAQIRKETIEALHSMGPLFQSANIIGLVEPLGFQISSLSSAQEALDMIRSSEFFCYRVLLDTFHHYLGPDTLEDLGTGIPPKEIGLVHISGVEDPILKENLRDEHRVFPTPTDRLNSKAQVQRLVEKGYTGNVSFEPFSSRVQTLPLETLKQKIRESIQYLIR
ncbi:MAG: TIM barrel protein [Spirochaetes bacterium]|nr:TIM barrel protein [Spirochaetota bacterium]